MRHPASRIPCKPWHPKSLCPLQKLRGISTRASPSPRADPRQRHPSDFSSRASPCCSRTSSSSPAPPTSSPRRVRHPIFRLLRKPQHPKLLRPTLKSSDFSPRASPRSPPLPAARLLSSKEHSKFLHARPLDEKTVSPES